MEYLIALLVLWHIARLLTVDRFTHWRGPRGGTRGDVQSDHLWLFQAPPDTEGDDDE